MLRKRLVLRGMLADVSCELMCTDISAALGDIEGAVILMQAELARRKTAIAKVKVTAQCVVWCGVAVNENTLSCRSGFFNSRSLHCKGMCPADPLNLSFSPDFLLCPIIITCLSRP